MASPPPAQQQQQEHKRAPAVGDIFCCGASTQGKPKQPDHLRARKVNRLYGNYSKAALLEDGRISWLHDDKDDKGK